MFTKNHISALVHPILLIALIVGLLGLYPAQPVLAAGKERGENVVTVQKSLTLIDGLPDLIIESITATPANPAANEDVTFSVVIKNLGEAITTGFYLDLFIDTALPTSCVQVGTVYWLVRELAAGASQTITLKYEGFTTDGLHTINGIVDTNCHVSESDENNNTKVFTMTSVPAMGPGIYDDSNSAWNYSGSWATWSGAGPIDGTMHYSNATGATASFTFQAPAKFILFFQAAPNRSNLLVSVDGGTPTAVNAYSATGLWQQSYTSAMYSDTGSHTVTISTPGNGKYIDVDAIQIVAPQGPGTYDDSNPAWVYSGNWASYSGAGPIDGTMHYSNATGATASFTFQAPAKFILFFQAASNRSNLLVSVDGGTPTAVNAYSATSLWQQSYTSAMYSDTGSHTVMISTPGNGKYIDVDAIRIVGPSDLVAPAAITDLSAATGTTTGTINLSWTAVGDDGSTGTVSSYLVRYSSSAIGNESAWASATAVTTGVPTPKAAGQAESMTVSGLIPGQTYYFAVRAQDEEPNLGGMSNSASAVAKSPPPAGAGTYDDSNSAWSYSGSWATWSGAGPIDGTMHYSNATGATASFTFQAPAKFILFFQAASNRSNLLVSVDGGTPTAVNAYSATSLWQQSYTSAMYSDTGSHTVTISTPGNGKYIDVDAIQIVAPPTPQGVGTYDDSNSAWSYSGSWATWSGAGPIDGTMHYSNATGATASFTFQAPAKFILFFQAASNRSNLLVSVDGGTPTAVNAYSASGLWRQSYTSGMYSDTQSHTVTISTPGNGNYIDVDAIQILP